MVVYPYACFCWGVEPPGFSWQDQCKSLMFSMKSHHLDPFSVCMPFMIIYVVCYISRIIVYFACVAECYSVLIVSAAHMNWFYCLFKNIAHMLFVCDQTNFHFLYLSLCLSLIININCLRVQNEWRSHKKNLCNVMLRWCAISCLDIVTLKQFCEHLLLMIESNLEKQLKIIAIWFWCFEMETPFVAQVPYNRNYIAKDSLSKYW